MNLYYPGAEQVRTREGRPFTGGNPARRLVLHTWESSGHWPAFTDYPPHLAVWPRPFSPSGEVQVRQYVPFSLGAHSIRSTSAETLPWTWQIEIAGRASAVPNYPDVWYADVAEVVRWFITDMGVPPTFADFTVMKYGTDAPQRWTDGTLAAFSGVCGHGHVGRGVDTHWDPGRLDTGRLLDQIGVGMFPIWKIAGLAEEPTGTWNRFARLFGERHLIDPAPADKPNPGDPATWPDRDWNGSQTAYWFGKLSNVHDPEWPGFYARRELEFWAQATEGTSS